MRTAKDIKSFLLLQSIKTSNKIKEMKTWCEKIGIDPLNNPAYITLVSYNEALNDILKFCNKAEGNINDKTFR